MSVFSVVSIWKIFGAVVAQHLAHAPDAGVQLAACCWSMKAARVLQRLAVVVVAEAAVAGEAGGGALPAAVHGDEVDVHVDEEVALGRPLVDLDHLAVVGGAEDGEVVGVLGVVLVEQAARVERVVDAVADRVAQFVLVSCGGAGRGRR